jgi:glycosyltransferase involved in cell wall biosynthesis
VRILLTCHRDPFRRSGGSEAVVRRYARGLSGDHDVTVATALEPDLDREETVDGVDVVRFPQQGPGDVTLRAPGYRDALRGDWDAVLLYGQSVWVTNQAVALLPDLEARTVYLPVGFYNRKRAHARNPLQRAWDAVYYRTVQTHLLEAADAVVAVTRAGARDVRELATPRELHRIPNGVDPGPYAEPAQRDPRDELDIPPEAPLLVNVGGDYPNKRLDVAAEAARRVDPDAGDPVLCLCGPGTEDRGDPPRVRGLGFVDEDMKRALLQEADALLLSSDFEGYGLVLLEALAAGTPFVSTPVGAAPELAEAGGGRVAAGLAADALSEAVEAELEADRDPDPLRALARNHDWDRVLEDVEAVLAGDEPRDWDAAVATG